LRWAERSVSLPMAVGGVPDWHRPQIPPADLHIPILGQLAPAPVTLGDALEPGPLQVGASTHRSVVVRSGIPLRGAPLVVGPYGAGDRGSGQPAIGSLDREEEKSG
jgi:hypothetical protein